MSPCPCGSNQAYSNCCEIIHKNTTLADMPEKLMRARYSAHALNLVDFILATYHPSCDAKQYRQSIKQATTYQWNKLQIIRANPPSDVEGFVEFKAEFSYQDQIYHMHEKSRFIKENNLWFYIDGDFFS